MRTPLLWTLPILLAALPAQEPSLRTAAEQPPIAAIDDTQDAEADLTARALAARDRLADQRQPRVLFDQPEPGGPLWAGGTNWKASFDSTGTTFVPFFGSDAPRNFPLRLELASVQVGGEALPLVPGTPRVEDGVVRTERGSLTECMQTGLERLEHSFVFRTLPNRGAIALDLAYSTELRPSTIEDGVRFACEHGHVDYTHAVAVDANGKRLPLPITWTDSGLHMEIPASFVADAALPLVLDPFLNAWFLLASGISQVQRDSDVASFQALGGRTLLVWRRQFSASDGDCYGLMFDGNLGLVQTDFLIDNSLDDWLKVSCAANNYAQNFLVVSEIRTTLLWWIGGRTIAANGAVGNLITIEREFVVGTPGNNLQPDVGSDPYFGVGRYTVVFQKTGVGFADIYMKQLSTNGGLVTTNAIALSTDSAFEQRPSISKSCGQATGDQRWLVCWQRTWVGAPFDQEIWGRYVGWNGVLPTGQFSVAVTPAEETAPSPGAPIDVPGGQRLWPVAFETATSLGQPREILLRLLNNLGSTVATTTVNISAPGVDDRDPECDSDGTRMLVGYTGQSLAGQPTEQVALLAFLPATGTFRYDQQPIGLQTSGSDAKSQVSVVADFSGGGLASPRYFVSFTNETSNTFHLVNFGGWAGGANFYTYRGLNCGGLGITATGSSAIGQTTTITVANGPLSATVIGTPGFVPLNALGCNCVLGVDNSFTGPNPLVWTIPNNPAFVGLQFSIAGLSIQTSQCLNLFDVSDTIDFSIR
jgi:hypothetical protein